MSGTPLTVVHIAWEYPPDVVGGLGVHVAGLAAAEARMGYRVVVLSPGRTPRRGGEGQGAVTILRAGHRPAPSAGPFLWQLEQLAADLVVRGLKWRESEAEAEVDPETERGGEREREKDGSDERRGRAPRHGSGREVHEDAPSRANAGWGEGRIVVHAHDWLVASAALRMAKEWKAPLAVTFHATEWGRRGHDAVRDTYSRVVSAWERRLASEADVRIAPSRSLAREALHLGGGPVHVAAGGFDPADEAPRRHPEPGRLFVACRLVPDKGLMVLLEALALLVRRRLAVTLAVAGDGPERLRLKRRAQDLGIAERVHWLGQLSRAAVDRERSRAWVCVVPSLYEPFGLSALEAAVSGVPLVASRVGGLSEWAPPVAHMTEPGDPAALAQSIEAALSNPNPLSPAEVRRRLAPLRWAETARRVDTALRSRLDV